MGKHLSKIVFLLVMLLVTFGLQAKTPVSEVMEGGMAGVPEGISSGREEIKAADIEDEAISGDIPLQVLALLNIPPVAGITCPGNNSTTKPGIAIPITANATDEDGTVRKVEYFVSGVKIGEDSSAPFALEWRPSTAGTYVLIVKATDNSGETTTSTPVNVFVGDTEIINKPPVISLKTTESVTLPAASVTLSGSATDTDGTIASYQWTKVSGISVTMEGRQTSSLVLKDLAEGTYKFKLTVTDNKGAAASKEITLQVFPAQNKLPVVSITSPANNHISEAETALQITAGATDEDGTVSKVEYYVSGSRIGEDTSAPFALSWTPATAGTYLLTVKATDNSGGHTTSGGINVIVEEKEVPNVPPVISLKTSESLTLPAASVTLSGSATDTDGTIASYQWTKVSGISVTMEGRQTSSLVLKDLAEGTYKFKLTATDNKGAAASKEITLQVLPAPNKLPVVSITSPANNHISEAETALQITAGATDEDGTVSKVEYYISGSRIGEDTSAPFALSWTPATAGTYLLTVKATDNSGGHTTSGGINVIVEEKEVPNVPPVISLKTSESLTLPAASVTLSGSATDADGTIASYQWTKVSGISVTMEGRQTSSLVLKDLAEGTYKFKLTVTDNKGAAASKEITLQVLPAQNKLPVVSISSPANNYISEAETALQITAGATDEDGTVSKVEYYVSGSRIGEDTSAPFALSWTPATAGTYLLTVKATDNSGGHTTSGGINVIVEEKKIPNKPPLISQKEKVSITLPVNSVTLTAQVTDPDGSIASYKWTRLSGAAVTMEGTETSSLRLKDLTEGSYKFKLEATDNDGALTSKEVLVEVLPAPNKLPVVSITSPANNAKLVAETALQITAAATDEDGTVSKVEFFIAGGKIGEDTSAPFAFNWTPATAGTYVLTVKATDNSGESTSSSAVSVNVEEKENVAPVISLREQEELSLPENKITLAASASDEDGSVESYEWTQVSGPAAGMSGNNTVSLQLSQLEEGLYVFRLTVTDNRGGVTYKDVKVIVYPRPNQMPDVSITSPSLNSVYVIGEKVEILAEASDPDGTIRVVEFFQGEKKLGEDTSAPYAYTWTPSETGGFSLIAKVTDNEGAISVSNTGFVRIEEAQEPENIAPKISLKETETITLPVNTITLKATATDADGTIASYEWTKISGGDVKMSGISLASLKLENLLEGTYEFSVSVSDDDGATASRSVLVEVLPNINLLPLISIKSPGAKMTFETGSVVDIAASASDPDGTITRVVFFAGFIKIGEVTAAPYAYSWTPESPGTYSVTAKAFDNSGGSAISEAVLVKVKGNGNGQKPGPPPVVENPGEKEKEEAPVTEFKGEGTILREFFGEIEGASIADIPLEEQPTTTELLHSLEGPANAGHNYGSRIRGYVHPPVSGKYTFWISGDDFAVLYLSSDENPDNKKPIAQAAGNKIMRQWNKDEDQQSVAVNLEGGRKYYIEVLHKEAGEEDHIAVGWQLADGTYERPIPGSRLSPYVPQKVLAVKPDTDSLGGLKLYPNPAKDKLYLEVEKGTAGEAFWTILDLQGKTYNQPQSGLNLGNSGAQEIDISGLNLPPGLYMIKIKTIKDYHIIKFMKN